MQPIAKFLTLAVLAATAAACSQQQQPATPTATASVAATAGPPVSAIPLTAPAAGGSAAAAPVAARGPSLAEMLKRPGFARAFQAMDGAAGLPEWARGSGAAEPSRHVEVEGKPMLLAHVCDSSDCSGGQMYLLVDSTDHRLQGLLLQSSGSAGASVQQLAWLGKPDASAQAFLKERVQRN